MKGGGLCPASIQSKIAIVTGWKDTWRRKVEIGGYNADGVDRIPGEGKWKLGFIMQMS